MQRGTGVREAQNAKKDRSSPNRSKIFGSKRQDKARICHNYQLKLYHLGLKLQ